MYPIKENKLLITSKFGKRTITYNKKKITSFHKGEDLIGANKSIKSEIVAFDDGTVTKVVKEGKKGGTACVVRLQHKHGYYTYYCHLKSKSIVVNQGEKVKKGQKLGIIGATGMAIGVHLHFQVDKGSGKSAIDPFNFVFNNKELVPIKIVIPKRGYYQRGDKSESIKRIDDWLFEKYGDPKVKGKVFGPNTEKYVKQFQTEAKAKDYYTGTGAKIDGKIGPLTLRAMEMDGFLWQKGKLTVGNIII